MPSRRHVLACGAVAASSTVSSRLFAQSQPPNVTRIVCGFPPGSSADSLSRVLATKLATPTATVVVDNRTGAGGRIAVENVKSSPPDGQSLLVTPDAIMMLYPHVYRSLPYDPVKDFRAVTVLANVPLAFAVGPVVPAEVKTLNDFARWAKANPGSASFGTSGAGTTLHFTGVMFARSAQFDLTHIPYRGANLAAQDVAAGQLAACVAVLSDLLALAQGGKLRLLGISSPRRSRFVPEVATFAEQGLKDLEWSTWYGLFAPARTPEARIQQLQQQANEGMRQPDVAEALGRFGMEPAGPQSLPFAALLQRDIDHWGAIVRQVGYTATD